MLSENLETEFPVLTSEGQTYITIDGPTFAMVDNTGTHRLLIQTGGIKEVETEFLRVIDINILDKIFNSTYDKVDDYVFGLTGAKEIKTHQFDNTDMHQICAESMV